MAVLCDAPGCVGGMVTCDNCDGSGRIRFGGKDSEVECPYCRGAGEVKCDECGGKGYLPN